MHKDYCLFVGLELVLGGESGEVLHEAVVGGEAVHGLVGARVEADEAGEGDGGVLTLVDAVGVELSDVHLDSGVVLVVGTNMSAFSYETERECETVFGAHTRAGRGCSGVCMYIYSKLVCAACMSCVCAACR